MVNEPGLVILGLRLEVRTRTSRAAARLTFGRGLNIIRADNTSGKSTIMQGIVFGLGIEGMLGPKKLIPLPHAMTNTIDLNGTEEEVIESWVELDLQNRAMESIRVVRSVKSATRDKSLVSVSRIDSEESKESDYHVGRSGSAVGSSGFHQFLSGFVGWDLPRVRKYDGSESPLYWECVFPFHFVEQKHGWSSLPARIPKYFQIREVEKRSIEFLLGLDEINRLQEIERVSLEMDRTKNRWQEAVAEFLRICSSVGAIVGPGTQEIGKAPTPFDRQPMLRMDDNWIVLPLAIEILRNRVLDLGSVELREVANDWEELEAQLEDANSSMRQVLMDISVVGNQQGMESARRARLETRLELLAEDLQKHIDSRLLSRIGSKFARELVQNQTCPTCHQFVSDGLDFEVQAMTVEESIDFIRSEMAAIRSAIEDSERIEAATDIRISSFYEDAKRIRRHIRYLKSSLVSPDRSLNAAAIAERIELDDRINGLESAEHSLVELRISEIELNNEWIKLQSVVKDLRSLSAGDGDRQKLDLLLRNIRRQLELYNFQSIRPDQIEIASDSYGLAYEGFDLGFDVSASDLTRLIWAFLLSVMIVSRERDGNHLGLMIFDEPRQQDTAVESFGALLREAYFQTQQGSQVIIASSEQSQSLGTLIGEMDATIIDLDSGSKFIAKL